MRNNKDIYEYIAPMVLRNCLESKVDTNYRIYIAISLISMLEKETGKKLSDNKFKDVILNRILGYIDHYIDIYPSSALEDLVRYYNKIKENI